MPISESSQKIIDEAKRLLTDDKLSERNKLIIKQFDMFPGRFPKGYIEALIEEAPNEAILNAKLSHELFEAKLFSSM